MATGHVTPALGDKAEPHSNRVNIPRETKYESKDNFRSKVEQIESKGNIKLKKYYINNFKNKIEQIERKYKA